MDDLHGEIQMYNILARGYTYTIRIWFREDQIDVFQIKSLPR